MMILSEGNLFSYVTLPELETLNSLDLSRYAVIQEFTMHPDANTIAFRPRDESTVYVVDVATGAELAVFEGFNARLWRMALTDDTIIASDSYSDVITWDIESGERGTLETFPEPGGYITDYEDSNIDIYTDDDTLLTTIERFDAGDATAHSFNADATRIAVGYETGSIRVYDVATGKPLYDVRRHDDRIYTVAYAPNGLLATASSDGAYRVWDGETLMFEDNIGKRFVFDPILAFTPDSTALIMSATGAGTTRIIDLTTATEITPAELNIMSFVSMGSRPTANSLPPVPVTGQSHSGVCRSKTIADGWTDLF